MENLPLSPAAMPPLAGLAVVEALKEARSFLNEKGIAASRVESEWLLSSVINCSRLALYLEYDRPLDQPEAECFQMKLWRRVRHEPLQYITGKQGFCELTLDVTPDVLIPRPETETLVETLLKDIKAWPSAAESWRGLDLGTGSGNIALALAQSLATLKMVAADHSAGALKVAKKNAQIAGLSHRVRFLQSNLFRAPELKGERFHFIVSNPPYIPTGDLKGLDPEVALFEPRLALDGGPDGLSVIRRILKEAPIYLEPHGWIFLEIGSPQAQATLDLIRSQGQWQAIELIHDLNKRPRVLKARVA